MPLPRGSRRCSGRGSPFEHGGDVGGEVHLAVAVLEDAQSGKLVRHPARLVGSITDLDPEKHDEPATRAERTDDLAAHALSGFDAPEPRTIDSHVARVRRKLGDEAARLETVWGIGYRFVAGAS